MTAHIPASLTPTPKPSLTFPFTKAFQPITHTYNLSSSFCSLFPKYTCELTCAVKCLMALTKWIQKSQILKYKEKCDTYFPTECLGIFLFALAGFYDHRILWKFLAEFRHLLITALIPVLEHGGVFLFSGEGRLWGGQGRLLCLMFPVLFYTAAATGFVWPLSKLHLEENPKKNGHYTAVSNAIEFRNYLRPLHQLNTENRELPSPY